MNIEISGLKKHFFPKRKRENRENGQNGEKGKKTRTKIINYCFYSINEMDVSNTIKRVPYYSNCFSIVEKHDFIKISTVNDHFSEKVELLDENTRYVLFSYRSHYCTFNDYLFQFKDPKRFIYGIVSTFSYILQSLRQLQDTNICFFQFGPENIVFLPECREKPVLCHFQLSLLLSKVNEEYISKILKKTTNYTVKPLEVHLLFYLMENNLNTVSYSFIEEIVEVFVKNLGILTFFPETYRETYRTECILSLKKYINQPRNAIVSHILTHYKTCWDVYGISMVYLHVFMCVSKVFSLSHTFIDRFAMELLKCVHPDPSKRGTLCSLQEAYEGLLKDEKSDWTFVNTLDISKMQELWDILHI